MTAHEDNYKVVTKQLPVGYLLNQSR